MLAVVAAAGVSAMIYAVFLFYQLPSASELADYHPPTATRVYAWDGTLIGEFSKVRRIYVPYDQIPPRMIEAFLAAEDHNFFHHGGVDPAGLSRALIKDVFNILQGRRPEGGSTITQQVAKNIMVNNQVSVGRKLKEAILAGRLEQTLSKPQILELYLNEIWLGYRSYGVGAASYNYFGKSISDLTLAQTAYLAALPKGSGQLPAVHPQGRRDPPAQHDPARHGRSRLGHPRRFRRRHGRGPEGRKRAGAQPISRRRLFRGRGAASGPPDEGHRDRRR